MSNYACQGHAPPATLNAMITRGYQDHHYFACDNDRILDTGATHHMTADIGNLSVCFYSIRDK